MYMWLAKGVYMQVSFAAVHMVTGFLKKKAILFWEPVYAFILVLSTLHYVRNNNSNKTERKIGEKTSHVVCVTSGNSKDGFKTTELFIIPTEINTVCKSSGRNITRPLIAIFINGSCLSLHIHHSSKIICYVHRVLFNNDFVIHKENV